MDISKGAILFFFALVIVSKFSGTSVIHNVGDSGGWTNDGNIDYSKWAANNIFRVGDTIRFEYNPQFHNVIEVNRSEFHTCNATSAVATYSTGNDSVPIKNVGHYYYMCGFEGHCSAGQRVDIRVPKSSAQSTTILVPGEASIQFAPEDSPNGLMPPPDAYLTSTSSTTSLSRSHLFSSSWFVSSKLGLIQLFPILGFYAFVFVY